MRPQALSFRGDMGAIAGYHSMPGWQRLDGASKLPLLRVSYFAKGSE
jgi:hypothetical protein